MTLLAVLPELPGFGGDTIRLCWHPKAVIVATTGHGVNAAGDKFQRASPMMYLYEPDGAKLTTKTRPDGFVNKAGLYVPTSAMFHDPDTGDVVSIGGIDWDGMVSPVYWRIKVA